MSDFAAIRFQPSRPLLRELSADRLNSILAEIRRNKPLPGRGITVRQTGQGTAIDLAASISRGTSSSAAPQPWDLIARQDPDNENQYFVTVRPGTLNNFLPTNWDEQFTCASTGLHYAKAIIATDGQAINEVTIEIDTTPPVIQTPQEFSLDDPVEYLFGLFHEGSTFRTIANGHITLRPVQWLATSASPAASPGQSPYDIFYALQ